MQSGEWKVQIGGSRVQTWYRHYLGARIRQWQTGKGYLWFSSRDKMTKRQTLIQGGVTFMPTTVPFTLIKIPKVLCTRSLFPDYRKEVTISLLFSELYREMSSFGKCQPSWEGWGKDIHTWYLSILVHHCITTAPPPVVAVLTNISYGRIQCLLKYKVNTYLCACIVK